MGQFGRVNAPQSDPRKAVKDGAERGLFLSLEHVQGVAVDRCPRDEGTLQRSAATAQEGLHGVVAFDTVYAVRQHEELYWNHPRGGQAKYLESALGSEQGTVRALIAQAIKTRLAQG